MSTESQYYRYNPEKRNIFIEVHQPRINHVKEFFIGFFMLFATHASAVCEVFLRKRFGERYITLAQSIGIFLFMQIAVLWIPVRTSSASIGYILVGLFSWVFLVMSIIHRLEIKKHGTAYDFKRFSLSDGEIHPLWYKIIGKKIGPITVTSYHVHVLLEPLVPIVLGFILFLIEPTRLLGVLWIICGLGFGFKNFNKAQQGRDWVLDNIDKQISNQMRYDVFIGRKPKKDTKGVYLPMDLPEDPIVTQSLYEMVDTSFESTGDFWVNDELDDKPEHGGSESGGMVSSG